MRYIYLFGALLFAAVVGSLTKLALDPMVQSGGMIYQAAALADAKGFGGEFELLFFTALPWILPAAWVVWIFLKMGKGGSQ
jgi:hypothetical protein